MMKLAPVTKPERSASSSQATSSATSCGLPTRPTGCWAWSLRRKAAYFLVSIQPGTDAVDADVRAEADGERVGEGNHAALGGRIGFRVRLRHGGARRRNGDDRTARFAQGFFGGAHQQKRRGQIGVDDALPFSERQPVQRLSDHDAGVGHERIEPAKARGDRSNSARRGFLLAHVARDQHGIARSHREMPSQAAVRQIDNTDVPT